MAEQFRELDWYQTPKYYDLVFSSLTKDEANFLEDCIHEYVGRRKDIRVFEPACGSGRIMAELARRGHSVTGFDLSPPMVEYANKRFARLKRATATVGKMQDFSARGYHLAYCLVSTFKYLLTEQDALGHLQCIERALSPGGVYVLGFHLTEYHDRSTSLERWSGTKGNVEVLCNVKTWPPNSRTRTEAIRSRLKVRDGKRRLKYETNWKFRTYSGPQFKRLLRKVPKLEHIETFDFDYDIESPMEFGTDSLDQVVILRKRK